jgi:hypothetical protein
VKIAGSGEIIALAPGCGKERHGPVAVLHGKVCEGDLVLEVALAADRDKPSPGTLVGRDLGPMLGFVKYFRQKIGRKNWRF